MELTLEQIGEYYQRDDHPMNPVILGLCDTYLNVQGSPDVIEGPPSGYTVDVDECTGDHIVIGWYPRFSNPRSVTFHYEVLYHGESEEDALIASWNIYESVAAQGLTTVKEAIQWE